VDIAKSSRTARAPKQYASPHLVQLSNGRHSRGAVNRRKWGTRPFRSQLVYGALRRAVWRSEACTTTCEGISDLWRVGQRLWRWQMRAKRVHCRREGVAVRACDFSRGPPRSWKVHPAVKQAGQPGLKARNGDWPISRAAHRSVPRSCPTSSQIDTGMCACSVRCQRARSRGEWSRTLRGRRSRRRNWFFT
jgi:hypothetical protein